MLIGSMGAIATGLKPLIEKDYEIMMQSSRQFPIAYRDAEIIINLAGLTQENDLSGFSVLTKKLVEVNCIGAVNILATFLPVMRHRKHGRIIFMSSVCSEINIPGTGVYSASKAFIDKLVKIAALENAQYGITVNSIQLGYTGIGMSESSEENMARQINKIALKRFCTMPELYSAIKFIIETEYYTGQNLRLDGGIR